MNMEEKNELPKEVVVRILKARDALVVGDRDEAYHQLYGIASPGYDSYFPWEEMEEQVNHPFRYENQIKEEAEVTAYATKLHQANETIKELERQNEKMKSVATGWRPLLEEVLKLDDLEVAHISEELIEKIKSFLYGE